MTVLALLGVEVVDVAGLGFEDAAAKIAAAVGEDLPEVLALIGHGNWGSLTLSQAAQDSDPEKVDGTLEAYMAPVQLQFARYLNTLVAPDGEVRLMGCGSGGGDLGRTLLASMAALSNRRTAGAWETQGTSVIEFTGPYRVCTPAGNCWTVGGDVVGGDTCSWCKPPE
jgi:hypothetical protein